MSKVALITGVSSGIGRATAEVFARQGYRLALAARSLEPLADVAIAIEKATAAGDVCGFRIC
ncbi:MAG: SDR family NAD(P)-dependent oxidoreductase [Synechococcus sp.]